MQVVGRGSSEGIRAHCANPNKHANSFLKEGSYSELFDFPIHYILPLKSLNHLHSYRAGLIRTVCGGGNPVGSANPLTRCYEVINSNFSLLIPPRKMLS